MAYLATFILVLAAVGGWLFLKRDPQRYIHDKSSPINFFFRWGSSWHHFFKVAVIGAFMLVIFSFYKYLLSVPEVLATALAFAAGAVLAGGKELLDKNIQLDDIVSSLLGIAAGLAVINLFF